MKILILGATGPSGIWLVQKCLKHCPHSTLVLYVRSPGKVPKDIAENPAVVVVEGQLDDVETLSKAMEGVEAVLSALGPTGPIYPSDTPIAKGYANVISIMQRQGAHRLICLGTTAIKDSNDKFSLKFASIIQGIKISAYNAFKEVVAIGDAVRASDLDWTIVRVPFLTNGRSTNVVAGYVGDGQDSIFLTREGFAEFVVKEIEKREWVKRAPLLSSGTKEHSD